MTGKHGLDRRLFLQTSAGLIGGAAACGRAANGEDEQPAADTAPFWSSLDRLPLALIVDDPMPCVNPLYYYRTQVRKIADPTEGVQAGSGADTVEFDPALFGGGPDTILLTLAELAITEALTIDGPGQSVLTIDAQQNSRIFNIDDGDNGNFIDVEIIGLTLTGGDVSGDGGVIRSAENFTLTQSVVTGNSTGNGIDGSSGADGGNGGGIFSSGALTITESTVSGNVTAAAAPVPVATVATAATVAASSPPVR